MVGKVSKEAKGSTSVRDRLAVGQALLRGSDTHAQVLDGPRAVVASLEMDREFRSDRGESVAVRRFERLTNRLVQPSAPLIRHVLVDHLMMQRMGKVVPPCRIGFLGAAGEGQEPM